MPTCALYFLSDCPCCEPLSVRGWITTMFSYPTSQWIQGHSCLKSFPSTCHLLLPSSFHPWRPLFISFSPLCNIICSLFSCCFILGGFSVIFNILSVLAVLQYSLYPSSLCWGFGMTSPRACPPCHPSCPSVHQSGWCFGWSQDHVCRRLFRYCLLQMIVASALPLWIMHRDYIKTSWSEWSIFNPDHLLVKPASPWSSPGVYVLCIHVSVCLCVCLLKWTWVRRERLKRNKAQVRLSLLFSCCLSVEFNSDRLYWHGI